MFRIKRLYTFMLQTFIPVFCMTFFICLFIVLMQFLWKYVDEMAGKGLGISVLFELFFYAALTFTPMALPLSILLASLMTFGNLSERLELLAMKAAGVSLIRIMRPLIIMICMISVGAFFFQNEVLPRAQVKLFSLLFSIRHKSPELDIPEGAFYKEIDGFNMYIKSKNHETGMLYDVMIYDFSRSFEDAAVIVADSGKMKMADDKTSLLLTLWNGESFENLKDQRTVSSNTPYRRESFSLKEIVIEFDANFNRMDESFIANQFVGKDMNQLSTSIDSLNYRADSIATIYNKSLASNAYFKGAMNESMQKTITQDTSAIKSDTGRVELAPITQDYTKYMNKASARVQKELYEKAVARAEYVKMDYSFKETMQEDELKNIRRHQIELHKKFTLSIACLIFFFIGAPLGAIIGKGGLGMPVIISIILFIVYYIIDNSGVKMARDGKMEIWQGVWLSSTVLFPLGVFFTQKAMTDSVLFNFDVIMEFTLNFLGLRKQRSFVRKDVIIEPLDKEAYTNRLQEFNQDCQKFLEESKDVRSTNFINFYTHSYQAKGLEDLVTKYNILLEEGSNAEDQKVLTLLAQLPVLYKIRFRSPVQGKVIGTLLAYLLPLSIPYYIFARFKRNRRNKALQRILELHSQVLKLIAEKTI